MKKITILGISGSLRKESYNTKLLRQALKIVKKQEGITTKEINLKKTSLPLFDEDLEKEETPKNAKKIKALMKKSQGIIIASPEYNSSYTAALKNMIDWASRPEKGEKPYAAFKNKPILLMAASPSQLGGIRGLNSLKILLNNMKTIIYPEQVIVREAHKAFNNKGELIDEKKKQELEKTIKKYLIFTKKLS